MDDEGLKMNYIIRNANYTLFGLIKDRANQMRLSKLKKIWRNWRGIIGHNNAGENNHRDKIRKTHEWIKHIEINIRNTKETYHKNIITKREKLMSDQIEKINKFREMNDLPSILKEFKKITRKPFKKLMNSKTRMVITW